MRAMERKIDFKAILKNYDYTLLIAFILISLFSLVMIYSASMVNAVQINEVSSDYFYRNQLTSLIISLIALLGVSIIPYQWFKSSGLMLIVVFGIFGLLMLVKVFGDPVNNAKSWINLFGFNLQPSEFAKLGVIMYLASVYAKKQRAIDNLNQSIFPPLIFVAIMMGFIATEPDYGAVMIIGLITLVIILCSGMNIWKVLKAYSIIAIVGVIILFVFKGTIFAGEKLNRFTTFLDPFGAHPDDSYQIINSFLAIAAGGLDGLGLGNSIQKLGYLPFPYTDFIISIIAEELGILGVLFVMGILLFFVLKGLYIGIKFKDAYGSLLAIGISGMIAIQTVVNLAGATSLLPLTGVTLPFVSYGGTSLLVLSISLGILINISTYKKQLDRADKVKKV